MSQRVQAANDRILARRPEQPKRIAESMLKIEGGCRDSEKISTTAVTDSWMLAKERSAKLAEADRLHGAKVAYVRSGCPKRHRRELELTGTEWLEKRDRIIGQLGEGFLIALLGKRGPGKTQLAQQAILEMCNKGHQPMYIRAMSIFLTLRGTYGGTKDEITVIGVFATPTLLVIDEMQERGETPWENRMLNHLLDIRYGDMKDTLLIANLTPDAFAESMGPSITERLRETGGIIECDWESFRK